MWIEVGNEMVNFDSFESISKPKEAWSGWALEANYKKQHSKKTETKSFFFDKQNECIEAYDKIKRQLNAIHAYKFLE